MLDNLRVHKVAGLAELVEARGLSAYCFCHPTVPDSVPIVLAFSRLKRRLCTVAARTRGALTGALQAALT